MPTKGKFFNKGIWKHKKFKNNEFIGSYERDATSERVFVLKSSYPIRFSRTAYRYRKITFESWQAAKAAGWVKE